MRSGNLYTKLHIAGRNLGRQGRYVTCLLAGLLLFSVTSIAQLSFDNGTPQSASYCINSTNSIDNLLKATDATGGLTLTWTVSSAPTNGTLGGFPYATTSVAATSVTPSGMT